MNDKVTEPITRTVRVTVTKDVTVTINPSMFFGMSVEEYLAEFRKGLWGVESIDDVATYAAKMGADSGHRRQEDGLGWIGATSFYRPEPLDVAVDVLYEDVETEILKS